jgi:NAD(P)-dependent dehydrogenase (short-subunit alcohol dehydrogenase family)
LLTYGNNFSTESMILCGADGLAFQRWAENVLNHSLVKPSSYSSQEKETLTMGTDFSGKVVMVTGASRGIGQEIARQFAERGASVAVHFHQNREAAEQTLASLAGTSHLIVQADLADATAVGQMAETVVSEMGKIDVLVNNAGVYDFHPIAETSFEDWQRSWEKTIFTNLMGPAHLSFHAARGMMKSGGGKIINITSRGAFRGEPDAPAYGASKAGLNAFSQSMAQALAPHNIFMFAVAPGFVDTDMAASVLAGPAGDAIRTQSPLNRVARPDEVARVVLFLAAEGTDYLTGCIIDVNGASYLRT